MGSSIEEYIDPIREGIPFNYLSFRNIKDPATKDTNTIAEVQTAIDMAGRVSSNDTTPGYLNGKLLAGPGITLTEGFDGGNETLTISGSSSQIVMTSGSALSALRVVVSDVTNRAILADSGTAAHADRAYGLTITAVGAAGVSVTVLLSGYHTDVVWAWDVTKPIFLGANGVLTQISPVTGFTQQVARPITATSLSFGTHSSFVLI